MPPLRAAMIGFGCIAETGHLPALRAARGFEVVAIADVSAARRERARVLVPAARTYSGHEALLALEGGNVDVAVVAAPTRDHASIAEAALAHGHHVLCETPLATRVIAARSMLAHARRAGRVVIPSRAGGLRALATKVRELLDAGVIGDVRLVTIQSFLHGHPRGVSEWCPEWRRDRAISGGGVAMEHGSDAFGLAFEWMEAYPHAVSAVVSSASRSETEDSLSATLRFPGGRIASVHLTWTGGMRRSIYTIHGDRGAIRVEDEDVEIVTRSIATDGSLLWRSERTRVAPASGASLGPVLDELEDAIAGRRLTAATTEDALRAVELIEAAYRSAREGTREIPLRVGEPLVRASALRREVA